MPFGIDDEGGGGFATRQILSGLPLQSLTSWTLQRQTIGH